MYTAVTRNMGPSLQGCSKCILQSLTTRSKIDQVISPGGNSSVTVKFPLFGFKSSRDSFAQPSDPLGLSLPVCKVRGSLTWGQFGLPKPKVLKEPDKLHRFHRENMPPAFDSAFDSPSEVEPATLATPRRNVRHGLHRSHPSVHSSGMWGKQRFFEKNDCFLDGPFNP